MHSLKSSNLIFDDEVVKDKETKTIIQTLEDWRDYFIGTERHVPSLREYITAIMYSYENAEFVALDRFFDKLDNDIMTGTTINYVKNVVEDRDGGFFFPNIPKESGFLHELIIDTKWRKYLSSLLGVKTNDIDEVIEILKKASGGWPYILGLDSNKFDGEIKEVTVNLYRTNDVYRTSNGGLGIDCGSIDYGGRVLSVKELGKTEPQLMLQKIVQPKIRVEVISDDTYTTQDLYEQELKLAKKLLGIQ